jgi:hypothetical protein
MTNAGCDFLMLNQKFKQNQFCNLKIQKQREIKIKKYKNSTIVIHLNYKNLGKNNAKLNSFINNINKYLELNYKIVLIYPIPQFSSNVSDSLSELYNRDRVKFFDNILKKENYVNVNYEKFMDDVKTIHNSFDKIVHKNLYRVFPQPIFCNNLIKDKCLGNSSEDIYFIDKSHLSRKGSNMINASLIKVIDQIYSKN